MRIIEPRKCEMEIERPDGTIENIIHPKTQACNDALLQQVNAAMADAGKGRVLSYRNLDAVVEYEESDYRTNCEHCGAAIDARNAYSQKEWGRIGGSKVRVTAHYCDSCARLLNTIGEGEHTAMQERATEQPDMAPETKAD